MPRRAGIGNDQTMLRVLITDMLMGVVVLQTVSGRVGAGFRHEWGLPVLQQQAAPHQQIKIGRAHV